MLFFKQLYELFILFVTITPEIFETFSLARSFYPTDYCFAVLFMLNHLLLKPGLWKMKQSNVDNSSYNTKHLLNSKDCDARIMVQDRMANLI